MNDAKAIIDTLGLQPHPEGGWFAETWRDDTRPRAKGTAIYFLLEAGQQSQWHKVDAVEIWHHYAGAALELSINSGRTTRKLILGADFDQGQRPQGIVPKDAWQKARPLGGWVLVGCTVSPGFEFSGFTLAEEGFEP